MNYVMIGIITIVFLLQILIPNLTEALYFDPLKFLNEPYRILTSMFLHGGFNHLFYNGLALFMFGTILEKRVGSSEYLKILIIGGLIGSLSYYFTTIIGIIPPVPALGISGGIYAIMGALAILMPNLRIFVMFMPMRMREAAILWIIIEFVGAFNKMSMVGHAAHLGGLIFGILYAKYVIKKREYEYTEYYYYYT